MQTLDDWRRKLQRKEEERQALGAAMASLEEWRTKEKLLNPSSEDVKDVEVLVNCVGGGLLQAAGVSALVATASWWGFSRVRGMTSFRKVLLTGLNGAAGAFLYLGWSLSSCQESFLTSPTSPIAARTRSLVRAKLPDHPLLAPFTAEEDERLGRAGGAVGDDVFIPPPPQRI